MNIAIVISCLIGLAATKVANDSPTQDHFEGDLDLSQEDANQLRDEILGKNLRWSNNNYQPTYHGKTQLRSIPWIVNSDNQLEACQTNDACTAAGGICQSITKECEGRIKLGSEFCYGEGCVCCINKEDGCLNEGRHMLVKDVCKMILNSVCENSHGTGECSILRDNCRDRLCAMLKQTTKNLNYNKRNQKNRKLSARSACFDRVCDCNWSPGGCSIAKPAPLNCACFCKYHVFWRCSGTSVECKNPDADKCRFPDTTKESCIQGEGDCGGY